MKFLLREGIVRRRTAVSWNASAFMSSLLWHDTHRLQGTLQPANESEGLVSPIVTLRWTSETNLQGGMDFILWYAN